MGDIALQDWNAWEHSYPSARVVCTLIVTGLAQVDDGIKVALKEDASSQSERTKTLHLRFVGKTGFSWEPVWFQKKVRCGDYTKVELISPGGLQKNLVDVK
ncbi:hypothetical protein ACK28Q_42370 [Bradyrhizobium japonicum]|uniref:hypothetical protein n=1 Tax=Bradyrhizobium TaxID=374 RepID=UPI000A460153|nr:hypothetical protein [Bradyrhizobium japonicum]MCS3535532.1 hypothetical protein [Bradyrhizobium japonicum]MCS3988370.1 hypothetical protein [Bradyrhizobium japonicum]MCS4016813.1 hypothetical protein [Bradyrhizobium japonicum]MCS4203909.1 hypothetical protein [Bradyrhizobium japonicum]MDH6179085.1 hypothetical protein [Bradyrhizobium japonicum]